MNPKADVRSQILERCLHVFDERFKVFGLIITWEVRKIIGQCCESVLF